MSRSSVAVVGGGPGGYVFALEAARLGAEVTLFEEEGLGGACLRVGCVPSKTFAAAAAAIEGAEARAALGITSEDRPLDFEALKETKRGLVKTLGQGIESLIRSRDVSVVRSRAEIKDGGRTIITRDGSTNTEHLVIATGSRRKPTPEHGNAIPAEDVFELEEVPNSIAILGNNYIAVELASFFCAAGSSTTLVSETPVLPDEDGEVRKSVESSFRRRNIAVSKESPPDVEAVIDAGQRIPNLPELEGLLLKEGAVATEDHGLTNLDRVYAIGDVTGGVMLAGVAYAQARSAAQHIAGDKGPVPDLETIPRTIFSTPEVGTVGLSEEKALQLGHRVAVGRFPFSANCKARLLGGSSGTAKVVSDADSGRILGIHLIGPSATDLIGEAATIVSFEATVEDVAAVIRAHPTLAEGLWESSLAAAGANLHIASRSKERSPR
jgi:dihydrolipoamide dehydrogenase